MGIVLIYSDLKVTTILISANLVPLFNHTCPLFTQHVQSSRIISTSPLTHDKMEVVIAELSGIYSSQKYPCGLSNQVEAGVEGSHATRSHA